MQMGAGTAHLVGKLFRRRENDCNALLAAGAGAGLATAFNSPIAGAVFVLEELLRRFDTRITIVTLGASAGAIAVARVFLGDAPDFHVDTIPYPSFGTVPVHLALGLVAGCLGVVYNRAILGTVMVADRLHRLPVELRAALIGAVVGLIAWFAPGMVGGGDAITQRTLSGAETGVMVSGVFASLRTRAVIVCSGNPRRIVRAYFGTRFPERSSLREYLLSNGFPAVAAESNHARDCRHGGILYCGGSSPGYRHHLGHRDDGKLHFAFADAQRLLRGDADTESAG